MAPRNGVKKRIVKEASSCISGTFRRVQHLGRFTAAPVVSLGANSSSLRERSVITGTAAAAVAFAVMSLKFPSYGANSSSLPERGVTTGTSVGVLQAGSSMTPAERPVMMSTGTLSPSLAAGVDAFLDDGPALTRSNPTASILVEVPSADSLIYKGSRLYKGENGNWVADLAPESIDDGG